LFAVLASASGGGYDAGPPLVTLPRTIPLVFDAVTQLSVAAGNPYFVNTVGFLNANGRASVTVNMPALPGLVGATLTYDFVTLDPTAPDGVIEISPPSTSTIVP